MRQITWLTLVAFFLLSAKAMAGNFDFKGEVEYVPLEGSYFRLVSVNGKRYLPKNFDQWNDLKKDGLKVTGQLILKPARFSLQMGGETFVEIVRLVRCTTDHQE
tara:strand:- start:339 stop:650 length:312 start_codon:yes stop_codon:yes gene_type:complete